MARRRTPLFLLVALLALPVAAEAREAGASAAALGSADAVRASAAGPAALYFNPAAMGRFRMYAIELGYDYENWFRGHGMHVAVSDSKTNEYVAAGMSYSFLTGEHGTFEKQGHQIRGALASGYRSPEFSALVGAGVHWAKIERSPADDVDLVTMDVGLLLEIIQSVRVAAVGYNLIRGEEGTPELPMSLGLGLSFSWNGLEVGFDTLLDFDSKKDVTPAYAFGAEYFILGMVAVRAGFQFDRLDDSKRLAFGLGYVSQFWGVDVSYRHDVSESADFVIASGVRFFLP